MQLGRPTPDLRDSGDLASGLRLATAARGHRPALTVLGAGAARDRRDEQAFASVFQWTSKGAHLLQVDADIRPGDLVHLDAPAGWLAAAVCLATWWVGGAITEDPDGAVVSIVHEDRPGAATADWLLGDAVDGTPLAASGPDPWAIAVQSFPDQPPQPAAAGDQLALVAAGESSTQADLLAAARALPPGRLGVHRVEDLRTLAVLLAARPAATGDPTVLVRAASDDELAAEAVKNWVD